MRFHSYTALAFLSLLPASLSAAPGDSITPDAVKAHVTFLADDLLEGRDTGAKGHEIAARYVATQFAGMGLTPANKGDWYQRVPMVEIKPNAAAHALKAAWSLAAFASTGPNMASTISRRST
jgi:hypothetical protein